MAIQVNAILSPRIITIPATDGEEITVQSLVTQIRIWEDTQVNMSYPKLLSASGKEDLGGEVMVGITAKLENAKVMFEARLTPTICKVTGGNLVAVDVNGVTMYPLEYSDNVMATITASSSATLQEMGAIQYASFNGGVSVDAVNGVSGTAYDIGTPSNPVNNLTHALSIAQSRGFGTLYILESMEIDTSLDFTGMEFIGQSVTKTLLTINPLANVTKCEFYETAVTGTLDGQNKLKNCLLQTLNFVNGVVEECLLGEYIITLGGGTDAHFLDCWSAVAGTGTPTINMGGAGQKLGLRNYNGGLKITNMTGENDNISLDLNSARIILDSTSITAGTVVCRGIGSLEDESGNYIPTGTWNGVTIVNIAMNIVTVSSAVWAKAEAQSLIENAAKQEAYVKNKKMLVKVGDVWHFRIYDAGGTNIIVDKELKDKNGNNVTDIQVGALAQELQSSV